MTTDEIISRITSLPGIDSLNPIQQAMLASTARAVTLIAPTGSGKTLAFATRIMRELRPGAKGVQAVVIAPSRELVSQTAEVLRRVATGWKTVACFGGHAMTDETRSLNPAPSIIVATPGRLLDHLQRGNLTQCHPATLVLDEYDKALELGFSREMNRILSRIGTGRSATIMTSATPATSMPEIMQNLRPEIIDAVNSGTPPQSRTEIVEVTSPARDKLQTLIDLLRSLPQGKAIVFVNHRESATRVYQAVTRAGIPATMYHGEIDQQQRDTAVDLLENGTAPVMIATDLAARGLDISGLNHIIHYHMPVSQQAWTHRNGRTARQQTSGTVYIIRSEADTVAQYIAFDRAWVPTGKSDNPISATTVTLHIDAGRKEKISRGDIVGFLTGQTPLTAADIGTISLHDHYALIAINPHKSTDALSAGTNVRIKGRRVRLQMLRDFILPHHNRHTTAH